MAGELAQRLGRVEAELQAAREAAALWPTASPAALAALQDEVAALTAQECELQVRAVRDWAALAGVRAAQQHGAGD